MVNLLMNKIKFINSFINILLLNRFIFWHYLVFDTPAQHPRISKDEKSYIIENIGNSISQENHEDNSTVPWIKILTSMPVWISILSNWSCVWGYYTLMAQAPAYFKFIHGWNIEEVIINTIS